MNCRVTVFATILALSAATSAHSQVTDEQCMTDVLMSRTSVNSQRNTALAFLSSVTEQNYEQLKSAKGGAAEIGFMGLSIGASADFKDFSEKRRNMMASQNFSFSSQDSFAYLSSTLSDAAARVLLGCLEGKKTQGLTAVLADVTDTAATLIVSFKAPPQDKKKRDLVITAQGAQPIANRKMGPGNDSFAVAVTRLPKQDLRLILNLEGYYAKPYAPYIPDIVVSPKVSVGEKIASGHGFRVIFDVTKCNDNNSACGPGRGGNSPLGTLMAGRAYSVFYTRANRQWTVTGPNQEMAGCGEVTATYSNGSIENKRMSLWGGNFEFRDNGQVIELYGAGTPWSCNGTGQVIGHIYFDNGQ